ncbi:hypothetical protein [Candidatus Mycoplasma haematominutum]|uniref:Uncharacterized protein n=1 Tax=Candidatus Mycoplasma haematominutum 'Birmingham 1' TaxID=1116213 RepID=G8C3C9_9MOLU|nr:hypothetical protein [Candidatus Mycoplasma haematominutum]CCE66827.1 hypothetical protein MHM_03090 [Candidatus Mycoplasma haematominutum 'Birmingham 1']
MIFTKYLFSAIAGLTGGVNALVFSSSGGALVTRELESFSTELENSSTQSDGLIAGEAERLDGEKKESESNFKKLETQNEETKSKSRARRDAGNAMKGVNDNLNSERRIQDRALNAKKDELQSALEKGTAEVKQNLENGVKKLFETVKASVDAENKKLTTALQNLTESNKKLIERVKKCIQEMPNSIFVEPDKLKKHNDNFCDYINAEEKKKTT